MQKDAPTEEQEVGKLRFYFLREKSPDEMYVPAGGFVCQWIEANQLG